MCAEEEGPHPDARGRAEEDAGPRGGEDAVAPAPDISGSYRGCFRHGGWEKAWPIEADLLFRQGSVSGDGSDRRGTFLLHGRWNTETGQVDWMQSYPDGLIVDVHGVVGRDRIEGEWLVPEGQRGYWKEFSRRWRRMYEKLTLSIGGDDWVLLGCLSPEALLLVLGWFVLTALLLVPIAVLSVFRFYRASYEGGFELRRTP